MGVTITVNTDGIQSATDWNVNQPRFCAICGEDMTTHEPLHALTDCLVRLRKRIEATEKAHEKALANG